MTDRRAGLDYGSEPLAALLEVFALWGSREGISSFTAASGHDLDATSVIAVTLLGRYGAMRPSALAHRLGVGASNVSKITKRLGERDLLESIPDPQDARANLLRLTARGTETMGDLIAAGDRMMSDLLDPWTPDDRADFTHLLRRFRTDVQARADRATRRIPEPPSMTEPEGDLP